MHISIGSLRANDADATSLLDLDLRQKWLVDVFEDLSDFLVALLEAKLIFYFLALFRILENQILLLELLDSSLGAFCSSQEGLSIDPAVD